MSITISIIAANTDNGPKSVAVNSALGTLVVQISV
jgi:hypothetical protein